MKTLFKVGAKLLGILLLYWALASGVNVIGLARAPLSLAFALSSSVLAFAFFYGLVFQTDRVASWVGMSDESSVVLGISTESALRTGIALIGFYLFVAHMPEALALVYLAAASGDEFGRSELVFRFVTDLVPLVLSLVFILCSDSVARLASRAETPAS